jgi:hypothetical protein
MSNGRLPGGLDELVPDFLPAVSIDPVTEQPLVYRRTENGFLLYRTRPDHSITVEFAPSAETPEPGEDLIARATGR